MGLTWKCHQCDLLVEAPPDEWGSRAAESAGVNDSANYYILECRKGHWGRYERAIASEVGVPDQVVDDEPLAAGESRD